MKPAFNHRINAISELIKSLIFSGVRFLPLNEYHILVFEKDSIVHVEDVFGVLVPKKIKGLRNIVNKIKEHRK